MRTIRGAIDCESTAAARAPVSDFSATHQRISGSDGSRDGIVDLLGVLIMKRLIFAFAALLCVVLHGCSQQTKSERLSWVGVRFGQLPAMVGESNYKIKQREGKPFKSFEVQLERGKPGESFPVTLDGVEVGQITINEGGEGERG